MSATLVADMVLVAAGGALGCLGRYGMEHLGLFCNRMYNTVLINLIGCLLIGFVWAVLLQSDANDKWTKFLITGLLGGFTTFSAFSLHPVLMLRQGLYLQSVLYIAITVIGGLAACAAAMLGTERILKYM